MTTQREYALKGQITPEMQLVATTEQVSVEFIKNGLKDGSIVIFKNKLRNIAPVGAGKGLKVKVNANIGTSDNCPGVAKELKKLAVAEEAGADAVMDLSTGGDLDVIRKQIIKASKVTMGSVPIYQAMVDSYKKYGDMFSMTEDDLFEAIEKHCEDGMDFVTIHCGVTKEVIKRLEENPRIAGVVSRGGSFLVKWIKHNNKENPLYEKFDRVLEICRKHDVVVSLGDGLRPGALADATDGAQIQELIHLGDLTKRCLDAGVQVIVEGPGHMPFDQIATNMKLQKELCHGVPFYVLGPLVTDVAPGYDHITSAIGGTMAAASGADFLCYVTPSEHLGLPNEDDVREGVMVCRIAAHAADVAKDKKFRKWDDEMSVARKAIDWQKQLKLAINSQKAKQIHDDRSGDYKETCTMCGPFCSMK